jgi:hypothetical protein
MPTKPVIKSNKPIIPSLQRVRSEESLSTNEDVNLIKNFQLDLSIKRIRIDVISHKSPRSC